MVWLPSGSSAVMSVSAVNMIISQSDDTYWVSRTRTDYSGRFAAVDVISFDSSSVSTVFYGDESGEAPSWSGLSLNRTTGAYNGRLFNVRIDIDGDSGFNPPPVAFPGVQVATYLEDISTNPPYYYIVGSNSYDVHTGQNPQANSVATDVSSDGAVAAIMWNATGDGAAGAKLSIYTISTQAMATASYGDVVVRRVAFTGSDVFILYDSGSSIYPTSNGTTKNYSLSGESLSVATDDTVFVVSGLSSNRVTLKRFDPSSDSVTLSKIYSLSGVAIDDSNDARFFVSSDASNNVYIFGDLTTDGCFVLKVQSDGTVDWCNYFYPSDSGRFRAAGIKHDGEGSFAVAMSKEARAYVLKLPDDGSLTDASTNYFDVVYDEVSSVSTTTGSTGSVLTGTGSVTYTSNSATSAFPRSGAQPDFDTEEI